MSENIPKFTADYTDLPNGERVWVQTASDIQLEEIRDEASWYAREKVNPFRKGNSRYKILVDDIKEAGAEGQSALIAQEGYLTGEYREKVWEKYPKIDKPTRDREDTDETFMQKQDSYLEKVKETDEKRGEYAAELYKEKYEEAMSLSSQKRLNRAVESSISQKYSESWQRGYTNQLLFTVVRLEDDHSEKYFKSPQILEDKQYEKVRLYLIEFYNTKIDTVQSEEIPTSPVE